MGCPREPRHATPSAVLDVESSTITRDFVVALVNPLAMLSRTMLSGSLEQEMAYPRPCVFGYALVRFWTRGELVRGFVLTWLAALLSSQAEEKTAKSRRASVQHYPSCSTRRGRHTHAVQAHASSVRDRDQHKAQSIDC